MKTKYASPREISISITENYIDGVSMELYALVKERLGDQIDIRITIAYVMLRILVSGFSESNPENWNGFLKHTLQDVIDIESAKQNRSRKILQ